MKLIDEIILISAGQERSVALYVGDLASIPEREAVDLLIVSAFPDDYIPTSTSLIGALHRQGVSVAALATAKDVDLRQFSSCWLSREIRQPTAHFRRLMCFEPLVRGAAPEVVGDVFRSLMPFCAGTPPISQIAMPILAAGDQGEAPAVMLSALVDASLHWLMIGVPITRIKIVMRSGSAVGELTEVFSRAKTRFHTASTTLAAKTHRFDAFLSYSRKDQDAADQIANALKYTRPTLRLFVDRLELQTGAAWQQHIFEALDECRKVIPLLSPSYIESKVCKEEFNIALFRHRDSSDGILVPIFLRSAALPTYMRLVQYLDVREADFDKLSAVTRSLLQCLEA